MNFSLTIPGVFYDLIARVVPGYFLTLITRLIMPQVYNHGKSVLDVTPSDGIGALASMLGFAVTCYLLGWLLHGAALLLRMPRWARPTPPEQLYRKYHYVKLKSESLGYRLLKLRAEATMLETCLIACALIFVADGFMKAGEVSTRVELLALSVRVLTYLGTAASFCLAYRLAWDRYFGTVDMNYELICAEHAEKQTPAPNPSTNAVELAQTLDAVRSGAAL